MKNEENKEFIKGFDDNRMYVDETHSYPKFLLDYLFAYGIQDGYRYGSYYYTKEGFEREELEVTVDDNVIKFYSPSRKIMIARIDTSNNMVYYMDGVASSVGEWYDDGVYYARNGRAYYIKVNSDPLGNIKVQYKHNAIEKEVIVRVGEYGPRTDYLGLLKSQIDETTIDNEDDLKIVRAMFFEPRLRARIKRLASFMAPDIDDAYKIKANAIKAKYQDLIEEIMQKQREEVGKLTEYYQEYMKSLNSQDSKSKK